MPATSAPIHSRHRMDIVHINPSIHLPVSERMSVCAWTCVREKIYREWHEWWLKWIGWQSISSNSVHERENCEWLTYLHSIKWMSFTQIINNNELERQQKHKGISQTRERELFKRTMTRKRESMNPTIKAASCTHTRVSFTSRWLGGSIQQIASREWA